MGFLAQPKYLSQASFKMLVDSLRWDKGWHPKFVVLHNTGVPTLKTWQGWTPAKKAAWGGNLNRYYRSLGWHSGPHLFVTPTEIINTCDLERDGVHCSCWNRSSFGVEMTGDYDKEDFTRGDGKHVADNAAFAIAVLSSKLHLSVKPLLTGYSGLHMHRMCVRDHHHCPGDHVNYADFVEHVDALMGALL
jgi:hypothetical protein